MTGMLYSPLSLWERVRVRGSTQVLYKIGKRLMTHGIVREVNVFSQNTKPSP